MVEHLLSHSLGDLDVESVCIHPLQHASTSSKWGLDFSQAADASSGNPCEFKIVDGCKLQVSRHSWHVHDLKVVGKFRDGTPVRLSSFNYFMLLGQFWILVCHCSVYVGRMLVLLERCWEIEPFNHVRALSNNLSILPVVNSKTAERYACVNICRKRHKQIICQGHVKLFQCL